MSTVVERKEAESPVQDLAAQSESTISPGTDLDEKRVEDVAAESQSQIQTQSQQPSDEEAAPSPPPPAAEAQEPPPNGGAQAWLIVLGAHFLFCNSW